MLKRVTLLTSMVVLLAAMMVLSVPLAAQEEEPTATPIVESFGEAV